MHSWSHSSVQNGTTSAHLEGMYRPGHLCRTHIMSDIDILEAAVEALSGPHDKAIMVVSHTYHTLYLHSAALALGLVCREYVSDIPSYSSTQ